MERLSRSFPLRQLRARPLFCFAAAFLVGLIAARLVAVPVAACLIACAVCGLLILAFGIKRRRLAAAFMLLGFCLGLTRMGLAVSAFKPVQTRYSVHMTGRIASEPFKNPKTGRVISRFQLESAGGEACDLTVRLYLRGDEALLGGIDYGQRLSLTGHLWQNDPVTNPYEFDFGEYLHRNGMSVIATAKIEDVEILNTSRDAQSFVIAVRRAIAARIDRLFPQNAPLIRALVLGDRSLLSEELREGLNATGTAHLIAISGLHVTVLAMALTFALGRFISRRLAGVIALVPLVLYGALIGFPASFARAVMMFGIFSLAPIIGVPSDSITRLSTAMLVWLMLRPMDIADAGFTLSYLASAGILTLSPPLMALIRADRLSSMLPRLRGPRRQLMRGAAYMASLTCASIAANLATLPAVIAYFGMQSVVSLPFNLICVPLCMLGYMLALPVLVVSAVALGPAMLAAKLPEVLFSLLIAVTRFSARLPVTAIRLGRYALPLVIAHAALMLMASDLSAIHPRVRRFLPLSLAAVAGVASLQVYLACWPFSVTFLDAGQADCAVVRTRGHTYMIDAGDTYTPAADYLSGTCLKLDAVFLSHPHQDHAGGLADILTAFRPGRIYVPVGWFGAEETSEAILEGIDLARDMGVEIVELEAGDTVPLSSAASATIWSPDPARPPAEVNDMSLLMLVESEGRSALFTGDLTVNGEPGTIPDCDILKVAHHGADASTSARFLEATTPGIAVISVGENSFGHPAQETLERLDECGAQILRTDESGAIRLTPSAGGGWRIETTLEAPNEVE